MTRQIDWHRRFSHQLSWTSNLRDHIYRNYDFDNCGKLLEIGCGTGALLLEIATKFPDIDLYGIDILASRIREARENLTKSGVNVNLKQMNCEQTSFQSASFDIILTNLMLLWVNDLNQCCREMHKILRDDGLFIIFSEPDYGGMIENPETGVKSALIKNLKENGADPLVGRKLSGAFTNTGFRIIDQYSSSVPWTANTSEMRKNLILELEFFKSLLSGEDFDAEKMQVAIESGNYFLYNPTFTFIAKKD